MALFSFGKKQKKGSAAPQSSAPGSPMEQIMVMQRQGLDTNTIVLELQRQGFNSSQIYDALNQVQMQAPMMAQPQMQMQMQAPPQYEMPGYMQDSTMTMPSSQNFPEPPPVAPEQNQVSNRELIEEIAEAIIDEKWKEFEDDLRKIIAWKEQSDSKLTQLSQQVQDLNTSLGALHKNLLNKISEYDRNIVDVGTEIKAMEKVFQKILPSLTENVNKLERLSKSPETPTKPAGLPRRPGME